MRACGSQCTHVAAERWAGAAACLIRSAHLLPTRTLPPPPCIHPSPTLLVLQEFLAIQNQQPRNLGFFGTRNMGFMHQQLIEVLAYAMLLTVRGRQWARLGACCGWAQSVMMQLGAARCCVLHASVHAALLTLHPPLARRTTHPPATHHPPPNVPHPQGNHIFTSGATGTNAAVIRGALRAEKPELLTVVLPQSMSKQPAESQELLQQVGGWCKGRGAVRGCRLGHGAAQQCLVETLADRWRH